MEEEGGEMVEGGSVSIGFLLGGDEWEGEERGKKVVAGGVCRSICTGVFSILCVR